MLVAAIAAVLALPAVAQGAVVTLSKIESINSNAGSGSIHPASVYPSTQTGPAGTVNDVNVAVSVSHANPDDLDVALVSPNGTAVHLFSDACGADSESQVLRFDDDANAGFLSNLGPCNQALTYAPSNYDGDDTAGVETDLYPAPGPDETLNALSFFDGGPSAGSWRLFVVDDTTGNGGTISAWELTLDFTPPAGPANPGNPTPPVTPADGKPKCKKKKKKGNPKSATVAAKKGCKKKKRKKP